jgi:Metal binding domain of Ada/Oxygenase, catalysing oxidative methylation of damaged DNA
VAPVSAICEGENRLIRCDAARSAVTEGVEKMLSPDIDTNPRRQRSQAYSNDDARWEAVRQRDRGADGVFFCAVRTTGVYCRPSCAGRPRRENVAVHHRPIHGARGVYRVTMRHGVSRLRSGRRHTAGIIFHDAK